MMRPTFPVQISLYMRKFFVIIEKHSSNVTFNFLVSKPMFRENVHEAV